MRYDLCNFAHLCKRGKMGCFERLISAVCWSLTAHFVTICQRTHFVFGQGAFCIAPAPLQFQWKSFSDYPTPFFIAGFSFWFRQKNKRTYFLLWPLAFGFWRLVVWKTGISIPMDFKVLGHVAVPRLYRRHFFFSFVPTDLKVRGYSPSASRLVRRLVFVCHIWRLGGFDLSIVFNV